MRLYAARALESGDALLLRLVPGLAEGEDASEEGVVVSHNPCLSGGALEIFLEPQLAAPRIVVAGDTPIARALATVAPPPATTSRATTEPLASDAALVVASHGSDEEAALARALTAGVGYVGLVASQEARRRRRWPRSTSRTRCARWSTRPPGSTSAPARRPTSRSRSWPRSSPAGPPTHRRPRRATAIDPICGMEVVVSPATPQLDGVYFCCEGCRDRYAASRS